MSTLWWPDILEENLPKGYGARVEAWSKMSWVGMWDAAEVDGGA